MSNPFYLQELPNDAPFCDRETELFSKQSFRDFLPTNGFYWRHWRRSQPPN